MRLRPLNPAVTGHTDGPSGTPYELDEYGAITVTDELGRQMLEFPGRWIIDHTVIPEPEQPEPEDDQVPEPQTPQDSAEPQDKPVRSTGRKNTAKPITP